MSEWLFHDSILTWGGIVIAHESSIPLMKRRISCRIRFSGKYFPFLIVSKNTF